MDNQSNGKGTPPLSGLDLNRNQKLALCVLIGLTATGLSYTHLRNSPVVRQRDVVFSEPAESGSAPINSGGSGTAQRPGADAGKVVCHVAGCVKAPGVYRLEEGKRILDAVAAAGGPKPNGDLNAINLAARIDDGTRIYVPSFEETRASPGGRWDPDRAAAAGAIRPKQSAKVEKLRQPGDGVIHINKASAEELQRLPGVGPATAQKIVDYRSRIGRFLKPEQLIDVKGIGPKTFEKMRPFVAL